MGEYGATTGVLSDLLLTRLFGLMASPCHYLSSAEGQGAEIKLRLRLFVVYCESQCELKQLQPKDLHRVSLHYSCAHVRVVSGLWGLAQGLNNMTQRWNDAV